MKGAIISIIVIVLCFLIVFNWTNICDFVYSTKDNVNSFFKSISDFFLRLFNKGGV